MPDRAGQQLGNYRLLRLLGRGGFAEVYLGEHVYLKRRAALKVLHTSLEDEDVEQFLAESQTLARLEHPNIVRVSDFAVEQGTPFLVMDYAPRGTLRKLHPSGSCLSLEATVAYIRQVAAALQYAHNHQVIHRDVKPENMLLGQGQEVLLSDFGISLFAPSPEQLSTQQMAGTLPYMAPEQIRGKPVFASDQYSLGIVVYEWLCGVRPFEGSYWQLMHQHISAPPPPLREHDPSLPLSVEAVVLKALAKDPHQRYASVQLFAQAFEQAAQAEELDLRDAFEVTAPLRAASPAVSASAPTAFRKVFLAAVSNDAPFVARLRADARGRGITFWQGDPGDTRQALEQEHLLRQAIRAVEVVLVVISPSAPSSPTVKACLRIASLYQRRLVFVWAAGDEIADVLPPAWGKAAQIDLIDARAGRYEPGFEELVACLEEEASSEEPFLPEPAGEPRNPYKGLRAFTQADAADFFGRENLIEALVEKVKSMLTRAGPGAPAARLLAVIGPSGSGKSSVVMAGLLPRLRQGALPGSERWVYLEPLPPGAHPLEALALTLAAHFPGRSVKSLREDLEDESARGLHLLATQLGKTPGQQVVLLLDQFEELFTLTTSQDERQQFIDLLTAAVSEPQGPLIVLLTLRADFYDRPMAYPALHRLLEAHQQSVLSMEVADLRAVIRGPAALPDVQLSFEGSLVGDLLFEVQGQVGALPLLQFTLDQLFQRKSGHTLTAQAYSEMGGLRGALARHAESTYAALPSEEHRKLARALFLRLIDPGVTEQDTTRRRATLSELLLPDARQTTLMRAVADAFVAARLLTTNEAGGATTLEVSHEAVIREWARLTGWLREAREDVRLQQAISEDAAEWQRHKQPADRLYRGSQLKEAQTWARRNTPSGSEVAFLRASAARGVRAVVSVLAVLLLVVVSIGTAGWFLTHQPPDQTRVTNLQDHGPGSLRQAIETSPAGSTITFDASLSGSILLTSNDLTIASRNLTIRGPEAHTITVSSGTSGYMVHVLHGYSVTFANLIFKGSKTQYGLIFNEGTLILSNSTVSGIRASAGGIFNSARLTLSNSTVSGNVSGASVSSIFNSFSSTLTLSDSTVPGNPMSGGQFGSGIYNDGTLTLTGSTVSGNTGTNGGGIYNVGTLTLTNSTVSDNSAYTGGGILNGGYGTLTLTNSTISGNSVVNGDGGGILNNGRLTLTNSTISGNSASAGGGIFIRSLGGQTHFAQADLNFCTISGNVAPAGADIAVEDFTISSHEERKLSKQLSQVKTRNSIIAGDPAHRGPDISGTLTSNGYNLFQANSGATFDPSTSTQHSTDKMLPVNDLTRLFASPVELRDKHGLTKTLALAQGSPAIDQIPLASCHVNGIKTDQRGMKRPDGNEGACDIGAYEYIDGTT